MLTPEERMLLDRIDERELTDFLARLVRTNSENPPGREAAVGEWIAEELRTAGCLVELQPVENGRFNVIAVLEGERPDKMLFNGHMDTVPAGDRALWHTDPWGAEIRGGYLYGLGSADMKAGLAAMVFAVKALAQSGAKLRKGLLFTAVVDEEVGFKGTKALLSEGRLADCRIAYVSEPTGLRIANRLKGALEFSARTRGKSAHTGIAFQGDNAIFKMGRWIEALNRYNAELQRRMDVPDLRFPTVNLGLIRGGVGVTLVPDFCEVEFDRQVLPAESMESAEREVRVLAETLNAAERIGLELTLNQSFDNWSVSEGEEVVRLLAGAIRDAGGGREPAFAGFNGYAEVQLLASAGIPSVLYGPGSIDVAHAPNESVSLRETAEAAGTYAVLAHRFVTDTDSQA